MQQVEIKIIYQKNMYMHSISKENDISEASFN